MRKPAEGSQSEFYPLLDFVIQITVRGKYTAKVGELVYVVDRVTVNCKGRIGCRWLVHRLRQNFSFLCVDYQSSTLITVWIVVQTVLTATFNSYGNRQISTPHKISTPEPIETKIRHSWLRPRGDPLYQIWYKSTHWGLLGKWVKYNKNYYYLFIPFFSATRVQVRPVDGFLRAIAH